MTTRISTRARRGALVAVLALVAPIGVVATTAAPSGAALPACTKTWTAANSGSWDTASSWSGGTVPTGTDHVCITAPGTYAVTLVDPGAPITVASLTVGATAGAGVQTLAVERGVDTSATALTATLGIETTTRGAIELGDSDLGVPSIGVGATAVIANAGRLGQVAGQTDTHTIRGDVVNTGTFALHQPIRIEGDLTHDGLLAVDHVLHVDGVMWTRSGTITGEWAVAAHGGLRVGGTVIGQPGLRPVFSVDGGQLSFESEQPIDVTVYDEVTVVGDTASRQDISVQTQDGRDTTLTFTGTWTTRGDIDLQPGAAADVTIAGSGPGATLVSEEQLERSGEPTEAAAIVAARLVNRGEIETGGGILSVHGDVEGEGRIDLGLGRVVSGGRIDLEPGSVLHVAIDGTTAGRLSADDPVVVDGVLETTTATAPAVGSITTVVSAPGRTGSFDEVVFLGTASYEPLHTSFGVDLRRRASESSSRRFVRAAFQDFLHRQPDLKELSNLSAIIDLGNLSRATLVRNLSRSPEYVTTLVQRFYADTLGRPGDPAGVAFWVDQLRSGRKTVAQVAGSFYASDEFFAGAGGTRADWVDALYQVFFERLPSDTDRAFWVARAQDRGRTRVAVELFQSLESRRQRVERLYDELLQREGDPAGVDYWAGRIATAGDLALAVDLAASGEYLALAQIRYP